MLQIRKIKPEDIEFVLSLAGENGSIGGRLLSNIESFVICDNDNQKCGCGCIVLKGNIGFLSWVMVNEGMRRKKLGAAITKALLNIADLKGVKEVYSAGICEDFLEAMGFRKNEDASIAIEMKDLLGIEAIPQIHSVSLEGYFKPCSH